MGTVILAEEVRWLARPQTDPYQGALATWLEGKTPNTQQIYMAALRDFLAFTDGKHPRDVSPLDVASWKEDLKRRRAHSTIAHRLSALSSYYTYLQRPQADGRPLREHNPVQGGDDSLGGL
jgi:site-specific recombinase XerD